MFFWGAVSVFKDTGMNLQQFLDITDAQINDGKMAIKRIFRLQ